MDCNFTIEDVTKISQNKDGTYYIEGWSKVYDSGNKYIGDVHITVPRAEKNVSENINHWSALRSFVGSKHRKSALIRYYSKGR